MRWLAKAALQQGIGALPHAESVNYVFQRRVSRTLTAGEGVFRRKFARALGHLHQTERLWQDPRGKMCVRGSKFAAALPTKK